MPTIYRWKGYRFHFYSDEGHEPPHIHIRHAENSCKYWLDPMSLAYNDGMKSSELTALEEIIKDHREEFIEKWNEYFAS